MKRPVSTIPVAILGAGLTGMAAAYHLRRAGLDCRVFERLPHPGGHAITIEDEGYRFDRTGHLLHLRDPETRALVLSWLGDDVLSIARKSMVYSHGAYTRYPYQANTFGLPPQVAYECIDGFLKAHFAKEKSEPRNFEEFCLAHFGEGISRHFMIPYNQKLWGVSPREITAAWCDRFVPRPTLEDVIAGAVGLNDRELGYNTNFLYPRLGIGALSEALAQRVSPIELGRAPLAIDVEARELVFEDERVRYDFLISSAPLSALVERLAGAPEAVLQAGRALRCTHLHYLDVALDAPCQKPFHWIYVPEEKYPFYRVGCYSNFSPAMAPEGKASLYVELSSREEPDLPRLAPQVMSALVEMGLCEDVRQVRFLRKRRITHAYVIFDHAYFEAMGIITPFLEHMNILSTGRYGGWNYSSMEDALHFGRDAARAALSRIERGAGRRAG